MTVDEPDPDGSDEGVGPGAGTETAPADGRGGKAGTAEDAPIADADGGIEVDAPSWAEEETAGGPEQGGGGSGFVKP